MLINLHRTMATLVLLILGLHGFLLGDESYAIMNGEIVESPEFKNEVSEWTRKLMETSKDEGGAPVQSVYGNLTWVEGDYFIELEFLLDGETIRLSHYYLNSGEPAEDHFYLIYSGQHQFHQWFRRKSIDLRRYPHLLAYYSMNQGVVGNEEDRNFLYSVSRTIYGYPFRTHSPLRSLGSFVHNSPESILDHELPILNLHFQNGDDFLSTIAELFGYVIISKHERGVQHKPIHDDWTGVNLFYLLEFLSLYYEYHIVVIGADVGGRLFVF